MRLSAVEQQLPQAEVSVWLNLVPPQDEQQDCAPLYVTNPPGAVQQLPQTLAAFWPYLVPVQTEQQDVFPLYVTTPAVEQSGPQSPSVGFQYTCPAGGVGHVLSL